MHETVKKVDEETVTKENITSFTRDHSTLLWYDNGEYIGKNVFFLITEE